MSKPPTATPIHATPAVWAPTCTARLRLRRWHSTDLEPFAAMNADPEVMRYLPGTLTRQESDALAARADATFDYTGFGLAAVEELATGQFIGFIGLAHHRWFPTDVEIGWRLARHAWGRGLATEGARAWVAWARQAGLDHLISIAMVDNAASLGVMGHLGMTTWRLMEREGLNIEVRRLSLSLQ